MEEELFSAIENHSALRLHRLLHPHESFSNSGEMTKLTAYEKKIQTLAIIRQRMASITIGRYIAFNLTRKQNGKVRFNFFNGWIAQMLLFRQKFEQKPVSHFWFNAFWPILWQRQLLMPLIESKGIYCFYSKSLIKNLVKLIGDHSCLEVEAGDGLLAKFLKNSGAKIIATSSKKIRKHSVHGYVAQMNSNIALRKLAPQAVICSWPSSYNSFEK